MKRRSFLQFLGLAPAAPVAAVLPQFPNGLIKDKPVWGGVGSMSQLQRDANLLASQRLENVKFVLNKRWIMEKHPQINMDVLYNFKPGSVTFIEPD